MSFWVLFGISPPFPRFSGDFPLNLMPEADRDPFRLLFWERQKPQLHSKEGRVGDKNSLGATIADSFALQ